MALKKFDVIVSAAGQAKTYVVEAPSAKTTTENGMVSIGDFTVREGALIAVLPHGGDKVKS